MQRNLTPEERNLACEDSKSTPVNTIQWCLAATKVSQAKTSDISQNKGVTEKTSDLVSISSPAISACFSDRIVESRSKALTYSDHRVSSCQVVDLDQTFRLPVQRSLSRSPEGWQAPAKGSCASSSTTSPTSAPPKASRASSSQRSATNQLSTGFVRKK